MPSFREENRKKPRFRTAAVVSAVLLCLLLFLSCDMFNKPLQDFVEEWTGIARILSHEFDTAMPQSDGLTNLASGADRVITYYLANPQNYTLDAGVNFAGGGLSHGTDYTIVQDSSDRAVIRLTLMNTFLETHDGNGTVISPTVTIKEPNSGRDFGSYTVPLRVNSAPPQVTSPVILNKTDNDTYVICFNMPDMTSIHRDIVSVGISGFFNKSYTVTAPAGSNGNWLDGLSGVTGTYDDTNYAPLSGGGAFLGNKTDRFVGIETGISLNSVSDPECTITLTDSSGLTSAVTASTEAPPLPAVTASSGSGTLEPGVPVTFNQETANSTITLTLSSTEGVSVSGGSFTGNKVTFNGGSSGISLTFIKKGTYTVTATAGGVSGARDTTTTFTYTVPYSAVYISQNGSDSNGTGTPINPYATLDKAAEAIGNDGVVYVNGDVSVSGEYAHSSGTLTLRGYNGGGTGTGASITNTTGRVFNITGGSVTLGDGITLTGTVTGENARGGAVYVTGGNFTMESGSTIADSSVQGTSASGGGVYVMNGTFIMEDGSKITGSSATVSGGGVAVSTGGTFTMRGGTIDGTGASSNAESGGGVEIHDAIFTMEGGTITGNNATYGGGVRVDSGEFIMKDGTISDNNATNLGGGVCVINGSFTMSDTATIQGNTATTHGGGVYVNGRNFEMIGGTIGGTDAGSANSAQYGGGVYVNGGEFEMTGTAILQGNTATTHGGGVHIFSGGTFTMNGGTIDGTIDGTAQNTAEYGGGVFVSGGEFIMNNGTITRNTVTESGGGVFVQDGIFKMEGSAVIQGNKATSTDSHACGGGVYVNGTGKFDMGDTATIQGNNASTTDTNSAAGGGGVYVNGGTFTMTGTAKIQGNTTTSANSLTKPSGGGGVFVIAGGTFTMSGGTIGSSTDANEADLGGGVYIGVNVEKGSFTMSGGTIKGNTATQNGGGVFVQDGTFTLSGSPNISGNYRLEVGNINNVYLDNGKTITIGSGGLNTSARIGVTTATSPAAGTEVQITDTAVDGAESIFIPDAEGCIIMSKEDAVYLADSSSFGVSWDTGSGVQYGSFADAISALNTSGSGGTIILQQDIDATNGVFGASNNQPITFSGGTESNPVILDLNGHTINRALGTAQEDGTVISVSGALTLKDSTGSGKITGGNNNNSTTSGTWGGGVCVQNGAFFTMEGGNISYNFSEIGGGGVYVCNGGSFTMTGGTIGGSGVNDGNMNTSTSYGGGGVFVNGEFTMSSGTITGNITDANGGGVAVTEDGTFTMSGTAVISDNEASGGSGGGVYSAADFTMTGGTISSNTATDGGGVYMINSKKITMDGGAISDNIATTNGGGLYLYDGSTAEIGKNTSGSAPQISNNAATNDGTADNAGGGIYLAASSSVEFTRGTISSNTVGESTGSTSSQGGGVYIGSGSTFIMDGESAIIENNKINSNIGAGGGVCVVGGELTMSAGSITGNNAGGSGGGVYVDGGSSNFTMTNGKISGNSASFGGGVTVGSAGTFTISSPAVVSGNTITSVGGDNVYVSTGGKFIDDDNCVTEGVEEQQ